MNLWAMSPYFLSLFFMESRALKEWIAEAEEREGSGNGAQCGRLGSNRQNNKHCCSFFQLRLKIPQASAKALLIIITDGI